MKLDRVMANASKFTPIKEEEESKDQELEERHAVEGRSFLVSPDDSQRSIGKALDETQIHDQDEGQFQESDMLGLSSRPYKHFS